MSLMYEMARFGTNFKQVYFAVLHYKYVTEYKSLFMTTVDRTLGLTLLPMFLILLYNRCKKDRCITLFKFISYIAFHYSFF